MGQTLAGGPPNKSDPGEKRRRGQECNKKKLKKDWYGVIQGLAPNSTPKGQ